VIALQRLSQKKSEPDATDVKAGLLFALTWVTMQAPLGFLVNFPRLTFLMDLWLGALWLTR
jgi:hypothetical protein